MNPSIDLRIIKEKFISIVKRVHMIVFFLLVSVSLFVAILILLNIIAISSSVAPNATNPDSSEFDRETIEQVQNIDNKELVKPGARSSPFVE